MRKILSCFTLSICLLTTSFVCAGCPDIPIGPTGATGPKGPIGPTGPSGGGSRFGDWAYALGTTGPQSIPVQSVESFPLIGTGERILFDTFSTSGGYSFDTTTGELTVFQPGIYLMGWSFSAETVFDRDQPKDIFILVYVLDETNTVALSSYPFQAVSFTPESNFAPVNLAGEIIVQISDPNTVVGLWLVAGGGDTPPQFVDILLQCDFWMIKIDDLVAG